MKFKCPKPESEHEFRPQCAGTSAEEPKTKQKHKKLRRQNVIYNGVTVAPCNRDLLLHVSGDRQRSQGRLCGRYL